MKKKPKYYILLCAKLNCDVEKEAFGLWNIASFQADKEIEAIITSGKYLVCQLSMPLKALVKDTIIHVNLPP